MYRTKDYARKLTCRGQLEGPEEVATLLERRSNRVDLVDKVLHADDAKLAEILSIIRIVQEVPRLTQTEKLRHHPSKNNKLFVHTSSMILLSVRGMRLLLTCSM